MMFFDEDLRLIVEVLHRRIRKSKYIADRHTGHKRRQ